MYIPSTGELFTTLFLGFFVCFLIVLACWICQCANLHWLMFTWIAKPVQISTDRSLLRWNSWCMLKRMNRPGESQEAMERKKRCRNMPVTDVPACFWAVLLSVESRSWRRRQTAGGGSNPCWSTSKAQCGDSRKSERPAERPWARPRKKSDVPACFAYLLEIRAVTFSMQAIPVGLVLLGNVE